MTGLTDLAQGAFRNTSTFLAARGELALLFLMALLLVGEFRAARSEPFWLIAREALRASFPALTCLSAAPTLSGGNTRLSKGVWPGAGAIFLKLGAGTEASRFAAT